MSAIQLTDDFIDAHASFHRSAQTLQSVSFACNQVTSDSQAMAAFQQKVQELMDVVKDYQLLIQEDSARLYGVARTFQTTDQNIANHYQKDFESGFQRVRKSESKPQVILA